MNNLPILANIGESLIEDKTIPREIGNKLPMPVTTKSSFNKREMRGFLIGTTLGDAYVFEQKGRIYPTLMIEQNNKELIDWKAGILNSLTSIYIAERKRLNRNISYRLQTKQHPIYKKLRNLMYPDGVKIVNKSILKGLTDLGIATWYMDDGSFSLIHRRKCYEPHLKLHTNCFGYGGNKVIQEYFIEKYNMEWRIEKLTDHTARLVCTRKKEIAKFMDIVSPYIIPSMKYKLATQGVL